MTTTTKSKKTASNPHSVHSTAREHICEHALLADLGRHIWSTRVMVGGEPMGVLRAEADNDGFDVLLSLEGVHRAVQLKTATAKTRSFNVNRKLARAPGGCVVAMVVNDDLNINKLLFMGSNDPAEAINLEGYEVARHTRANISDGERRLRPGVAVVKIGQFRTVETIEQLALILFGQR